MKPLNVMEGAGSDLELRNKQDEMNGGCGLRFLGLDQFSCSSDATLVSLGAKVKAARVQLEMKQSRAATSHIKASTKQIGSICCPVPDARSPSDSRIFGW